MTETPIVNDEALSQIEARHKLASRAFQPYKEVSDSLSDIPALCATVKHLRAERQELWFFLTRRPTAQFSHAELIAIHKDMANERDDLQSQLEQLQLDLNSTRSSYQELEEEYSRRVTELEQLRAENEGCKRDAAVDHWFFMYSKVAADNTVLVDKLATRDGSDLVSRQDAVNTARSHDYTHSSGYRCNEGNVIAEKIAVLPAREPGIHTAVARVSRAIAEGGLVEKRSTARSWTEGKDDIRPKVSADTPSSGVSWQQRSFGFEASVGEGALLLTVFYEHGWKVGVNDRVVKHEYPEVEVAKKAAVSWARQKLKVFEAELKELERG